MPPSGASCTIESGVCAPILAAFEAIAAAAGLAVRLGDALDKLAKSVATGSSSKRPIPGVAIEPGAPSRAFGSKVANRLARSSSNSLWLVLVQLPHK